MEKYYLLIFNEELEGVALPSQACFDEKDMNIWLNSPSGDLSGTYEEELVQWEEQKARKEALIEEYKKRDMWNVPTYKLTPEQRMWQSKNWIPYVPAKPARVYSDVNSNFPNEDSLTAILGDYYLMAEMVANKVVEVQEVSEEFYHTFNKARMFRLSMTDIFEKGVGYDPYGKTEKPNSSESEFAIPDEYEEEDFDWD
jgi:hypothetical protein